MSPGEVGQRDLEVRVAEVDGRDEPGAAGDRDRRAAAPDPPSDVQEADGDELADDARDGRRGQLGPTGDLGLAELRRPRAPPHDPLWFEARRAAVEPGGGAWRPL